MHTNNSGASIQREARKKGNWLMKGPTTGRPETRGGALGDRALPRPILIESLRKMVIESDFPQSIRSDSQDLCVILCGKWF